MKRKLGISLMIIGLLMVVFSLGLLLFNNYENKRAKESSEALVQTIRLEISENESENKVTDPFDEEMTVREIDGYGYIGYISVPALGIDLPVMSQWDYSRLKISPCRYYGSTKTDNLVIAAHNYKVHFGYIGNLKPGDYVIFTDMDAKVYNYKVDFVDVVLPTDVDKVIDSGDDLILYTCTYGGAKRIVVRCSYAQ